jgi:hypothetical protein
VRHLPGCTVSADKAGIPKRESPLFLIPHLEAFMNKVRVSDIVGILVYLLMAFVLVYLATQGLGLQIDLSA